MYRRFKHLTPRAFRCGAVHKRTIFLVHATAVVRDSENKMPILGMAGDGNDSFSRSLLLIAFSAVSVATENGVRIHNLALERARKTVPEAESVIDKRTMDDYITKV